MSDWEKIGEVGVDSGTIMIADMNYAMSLLEANELHDKGRTGVAVSSGLGDGMYDVFARWVDTSPNGKPDRRVAEVRIVFIPEETP